MPNKKKPASASPDDPALEKRVDAMMDPSQPAATEQPANESSAPPLDIFEDNPAAKPSDLGPAVTAETQEPTTAPALPTNLLKGIAAHPKTAVPASQPEALQAATTPVASQTEPAETEPISAAAAQTTPEDIPVPPAELDDDTTDKVVDEIVAHEADEVLAAEDLVAANTPPISKQSSPASTSKLKRFFKSKWMWLSLALLIIVLLALPASRYKLLGLIIKKPLSVVVLDSKTQTAVTDAVVSFSGKNVKTDGSGKAKLSVPLGRTTLNIKKEYYQSSSPTVFTGFKASAPLHVQLVATGRQVPITIVNAISGQPIAGAEIKVLDTSAKTDSHGQAVIVLPTNSTSDPATVSLAGYSTAKATVQVTSSSVASNTIRLTPAGSVYFLSNLSGTIDVVKTNLDGSGRQTVLTGSGKEDPNNTVLLASPDWHYVVLEALRDSNQPALYVIDTSNDKVSEFDATAANFTPLGWSGDNFIYHEIKSSLPNNTAGKELLKSYNADTGQLNQLDSSQVSGNGSDYVYQDFYNYFVMHNLLVYTTQWYASGQADLSKQNDTVRVIQPNGQDKKDVLSFNASGLTYLQPARYGVQSIYFAAYSSTDNKTTYYNYQDGSATAANNLDPTVFGQTYPTYFASPSGNKTFWSEVRDGQNTLFVGDSSGQNPKQIGAAGDYKAFGWYSDNYLLVTKGDNQLAILPVSGSNGPLKLSTYYAPAHNVAVAYEMFGP